MVRETKLEHPLSQVVFVHDYIQLVFQKVTYSIYSASWVEADGKTVSFGSNGFADAISRQIGLRAQEERATSSHSLRLVFENGLVFAVARQDAKNPGPEAFQIQAEDGSSVVEANE